MKHKVKHIHFVGIGGSGMSGIAEVLLNLGYQITGSDTAANSATERLSELGAHVFKGHSAEQIKGADCIVTSTAVKSDNPEVIAARSARIPVVPRALMLSELMKLKQGIAVAGTHGKTTTTSLIASVLARGGLDPTFVIGGRLNAANANAKLGSGDLIVVEADESDGSFLNLSPVVAVVTNIDADHMETYGHDFTKLKQAFIDFIHRLPFYGAAILCADDQGVREIMPLVSKPIVTYGFNEDAQIRAVDIQEQGAQMHFTVLRAGRLPLKVQLNSPGRHNVLNALATIAVADQFAVNEQAIVDALGQFKGVGRRFQRYGEIACRIKRPTAIETLANATFTLIDDYGHHPVEMAATIAAARGAFPGRRLVLAFQPHRFTRTRDLFEDFVEVMSRVDVLLLADVYAAGETPIVAADGRALARALRMKGHTEPIFVADITQMPEAILSVAQAGDVVITMGAGSIGSTAAAVTQLSPALAEVKHG
jgi:UDP-N-acetylmuramate--alanine ligase